MVEEPINKVAVSHTLTHLSPLTYVDIVIQSDVDDAACSLKALSDTGAQISALKADLLNGKSVKSLGTLKLQPFAANLLRQIG